MKCQYSKPYAKQPYYCDKSATEVLDFGIGKAYMCEEHWIHFWENVAPYLDEDFSDIDFEPEYYETA